MTIRSCASLPYGCNTKGQGTAGAGAPQCFKFVPCESCSSIMPCGKEFLCDQFSTWLIDESKSSRPWVQCPTDTSCSSNWECKKLDFHGNEIQLSTEFDSDGNPDPTFPQHVYRVKFDSDYIRTQNSTTNPSCDGNREDTLTMTRSHAVFGFVQDEDGNDTTTPIVCEDARINQLGEEETEDVTQFIDQEICGYFVEPACGDNTIEEQDGLVESTSYLRCPWPFAKVDNGEITNTGVKFHIVKTRSVPSTGTSPAFQCERDVTDCGVTETVPDCTNRISSCVQPMDSFGLNVGEDLGVDPETGKKFVWPKHLTFHLSSLIYTAETETEDCNIPELDCSKGYYYENNWSSGGYACAGETIPGAVAGNKQHYVDGDTPYGSDYQFPDGFPTQVDGTPFRSRGVRCRVDLEEQQCNDNLRFGQGTSNKLGNPSQPPTQNFGGFSMCSPFALWEEKQRNDLAGDGNLKRVYREACWFQGKGKARIINSRRIETEPVTVQLTAPDFERTNPRFVEYFVNVEGVVPPRCTVEDEPCGGTGGGPPSPGTQPIDDIPCLPYADVDGADSDGVIGRLRPMRLEGGWVCTNQKYDVYYICSRAERMTDYWVWLCCQTQACQCAISGCADDAPDCLESLCLSSGSDDNYYTLCRNCRFNAKIPCGAVGTGSAYDGGTEGDLDVGLQGCAGSNTHANCGNFEENDCGNAGYKCVNISAAVNIAHGESVSPCPGSEVSVPSYQGWKKDLYIRVLLRCDPDETYYDPHTGEASQGIIRSELTLWSHRHPDYESGGLDAEIPTDASGVTKGWEPVTNKFGVPCEEATAGNSLCDQWDGPNAYDYETECGNCYNIVLAQRLYELYPEVGFPHPDSFCGCPGDDDLGDTTYCNGCDDNVECDRFSELCLPQIFDHEWSEGLMNVFSVGPGTGGDPGGVGAGGGVPAGGPIERKDYWRWGCDFIPVGTNPRTPGRFGTWSSGLGATTDGIPPMPDAMKSAAALFCRRDCNHIEEYCLDPSCNCPEECFCDPQVDGTINCPDDPIDDLQCEEDFFTFEQRVNGTNPGDRLSKVLGVMDIRTTTQWQIRTLNEISGQSLNTPSRTTNRHRFGFNKYIYPFYNLFGCNYRGLGEQVLCDGSDVVGDDGQVDCDNVTTERAPAPMFPAYREIVDQYQNINVGGIIPNGPLHFFSGIRETTMQFARPCSGWTNLVNEMNFPVVPAGQYNYREGYGKCDAKGERCDHESYTRPGDKTLSEAHNDSPIDLPVGYATDRVDNEGNPLPHCTYTDMVAIVSGGAYEDIQPDPRMNEGPGPEPTQQYKASYIFTKECDANWYSIDSGHMKHQANGCAKKPELTGGQVSFEFHNGDLGA